MLNFEINKFKNFDSLKGKISAVFIRGKKKVGFELEGKFVFENGSICVEEANDYGDFEFESSGKVSGDVEKYLEIIKKAVQAYADSF